MSGQSDMAMTRTCEQCGTTLPGHTAAWLCPRCLLGQAVTPAPCDASPPLNPEPSTLNHRPVLHYFGDYEVLHEIARGGMGVVYKARQVSLNRIVAVKMLLFGKLAGEDFVKRFRAEAEAAASLQHPNIVAIHEVGEHEGQQYFSMDYVEGTDLAALVREKPLPAKRAVTYLKPIAEAIHYAHQRGILHRDLKPSNILIDAQDQPRVTDFGLAKRLVAADVRRLTSEPEIDQSLLTSAATNDLTVTGQVLGSPHYMPPEQAGGKRGELTPASDVYSLGAILYHLLTGRPPFLAETLEAALAQLLHNEPVPPRLLNASVPRDLETICLKCLNKEPMRRYHSAQALAEDLGRWLHGEPIHARPVNAAEKFLRWCRRKPAFAATVAALHLVAAAGLAGILWQWGRAEQHAASETTQRLRAQEAVTFLELQRVEDLLEKDEAVMGVAYLARIVRQQPTNRIAAQRLLSALTQRDFALPVGLPMPHGKKVNYAEFSPDGRRVVTASLDLTARIWDARTGEPLTALMLHRNAVRYAHFSPDGERLVTGGDDSRAWLWDVATGSALGQPMIHTGKIWSAQFSPDGRRVLTASEDGTARVWDAHTGKPALGPLTHQGPVHWARFSPDGRLMATASYDRTVQVWDALTGQPAAQPFPHRHGVDKVEFSPDGKWLLTIARDRSTCVWDVMSGELLMKPLMHAGNIETAKFSPDGERIIVGLHTGSTQIFNARDWAPLVGLIPHRNWTASVEFGPEGLRVLTGSLDTTARLWDAGSGEPLSAPMQHDGLVWSARLSPDGRFAVTASADGTARLWDIRLGAARSAPMINRDQVRAAEFSPDGEWVVTASQDHTARIWNARTGQRRGPSLRHTARVMAAKFSPDGERVATASWDGTARLWDARTGQPLTQPLRHDAPLDFLDLSLDGQWLVTASSNTNLVSLWNARTGEPHGEPIRHRSGIEFVRFSPDGQRLLSSDNRDDKVQIRDVATGRLLAETPAREGQCVHGEFSPDGQRVLTASEDGTARLWNAQTLQPLAEPMRHKSFLMHARFSRDGLWVVTASIDGMAQVWDAHTGQPVGEPMRHRDWVRQAEFSPDGALVVTASHDGTARLWDARSGRPVAEPFQHSSKVDSAHFSPDGRRVLTASQSGSAQVWDVPPTIPRPDPRGSRREKAHAILGNDQRLLTSATIREDEPPGVLLAALAEAVIGKRLGDSGRLESVPPRRLGELRQQLSGQPPTDPFTRWIAWFLADRSTRTISPNSPITVPEYVARRMEEKTLAAAREAVFLAPTNAPTLAHLAEMLLASPGSNAPVAVAEAGFLLRHAVALAPGDARVVESRQRIANEIERRSAR